MAYTQVVTKEMEWKVPFKRDDAFPLDRSTIFTSKSEAEEYISATKQNPHKKGVPYVGQTIAISFINEETNEEYLDIYKVTKTGEGASMSPIVDLSNTLYYDDNNKLDIKIVNTKESYNALTKDNTGALTVPMMDVKATKLTEDIVIKDGPLASIAEQAYPDGKVPANTSIEDFLKSLLCVEIYPNATANTSNYTLSLNPVSITHNSSSIAEVDSTVTFNGVSAREVTVTKTNPSVKPFTYGYSDGIKNEIITVTSITKSWSISAVTDGYYSLSASTTNFRGEVPSMVTATTYNKCSLPSCSLTVGLGENKYTIIETAPNHKGSHDGIDSKYIVSNLGNRSESRKSDAITGRTDVVRECDSKTTTSTIHGVYPIFTNVSPTGNTSTLKTKIVATTTGQTDFIVEYTDKTNSNLCMFAFPGDREVTTYIYNSMSQTLWDLVEQSNQEIDSNVEIKKNNKNYKLWKYTGNALEDPKFKFVLSKKIGE